MEGLSTFSVHVAEAKSTAVTKTDFVHSSVRPPLELLYFVFMLYCTVVYCFEHMTILVPAMETVTMT